MTEEEKNTQANEEQSNETNSSSNEFEQNIIMELKKQKEENEKLKEQLLRTLAEMDNIRKRTAKQIEDSSKFAISSFVKDLINVSENLGRAMSSVTEEQINQNEIVKNIYIGIDMTNKELMNVFSKNNVVIVSPQKGDDFDHNLHQAVANSDNNEVESGKITQVLQNGYTLNDRLLRPAMVMVAN